MSGQEFVPSRTKVRSLPRCGSGPGLRDWAVSHSRAHEKANDLGKVASCSLLGKDCCQDLHARRSPRHTDHGGSGGTGPR